MMNKSANYEVAKSTKVINGKEIKVAVHTPVNVRSRQQKVNKIYDILTRSKKA